MAASKRIIAIDLGASSGRTILGELGKKLSLREIHRFPNGPVSDNGRMRWDFDRLWQSVQEGIRRASVDAGGDIASLGLDTWGVDYGLLGADGRLLEPPVHYRDSRTNGMMEFAFKMVPRKEIYETTGLQFLQLNTLYQLLAEQISGSGLLEKAKTLLMIPDVFDYLLTGVAKAEFTDVTTTQCYDPRARGWARSMLERLGIPTHFLPEIVSPGTPLGSVRPELAARLGLQGARVIAPGCHDTASAVAAVPARDGGKWAYLSSGTWSLMGVELPEPHITETALAYNFTNEGGIGGTFRFLKNISGLWLLQESLRYWREHDGEDISYAEAIARAKAAPPFQSWVDPDAPDFNTPASMPEAISRYCANTGQVVPRTRDEVLRTVFESLALKYRSVFDMLREMVGDIQVLHIVGGGSANELLNQFTANALGVQVVAGPVEATAIGNLMVQAMALGEVRSTAEIRTVVRDSFAVALFEPHDSADWEDAYGRWREVIAKSVA